MDRIEIDTSAQALRVQALVRRDTGQVLSADGLSELLALTAHGVQAPWSDPVHQREVTVLLACLLYTSPSPRDS